MSADGLRLHGYWRSTASYRVRIALALKGLHAESVPHDLRAGAQRAPDYLALAPQGLVPALEVGGLALTQSLAIMEWIEEDAPEPPLLPPTAAGRAIVRGMTALIACDIHPLHNLRVLQALRSEFGASEAQVNQWIARWVSAGLVALEPLVARHGQGFAFGSQPSLADCCLVPQLYAARRFGVDVKPYPRVMQAGERVAGLPGVEAAHPDRQPDAAAA